MFTVRTIVCKLAVIPDTEKRIEDTMRAFADACNFVAEWGRTNKESNQFILHRACYRDVRAKFGLSANLAVRAIARVAPKLAKIKTRNSVFQPTSVDYDARIFTFDEKNWLVGITLLGGRSKFALSIGQYQRDALAGKTPKSAVLTKRGRVFFLGIQVDDGNIPILPTDKVIGVDMGLRDIAVLSDGTRFSGTKLTAQRMQRAKVRRSLQSKAARGTRTTRRNCRQLLRRLKGCEARFQRHVNHEISRKIVNQAVAQNAAIAIEDLTGIRERTNKKLCHKQRGLHNSWAFYQLRAFLTYKSVLAGVSLNVVDPAYTSQTCACCGQRGKRKAKVFACTSCGVFDADENAAKNIAQLGAPVNRPEKSDALDSHCILV